MIIKKSKVYDHAPRASETMMAAMSVSWPWSFIAQKIFGTRDRLLVLLYRQVIPNMLRRTWDEIEYRSVSTGLQTNGAHIETHSRYQMTVFTPCSMNYWILNAGNYFLMTLYYSSIGLVSVKQLLEPKFKVAFVVIWKTKPVLHSAARRGDTGNEKKKTLTTALTVDKKTWQLA